jgi:hypothetical protein
MKPKHSLNHNIKSVPLVLTGNRYVLRKGVSLDQAAFHLLIDYWRWDKEKGDLDHYHWINAEGYLDASQWRTIALLVWNAAPEGGGKDE